MDVTRVCVSGCGATHQERGGCMLVDAVLPGLPVMVCDCGGTHFDESIELSCQSSYSMVDSLYVRNEGEGVYVRSQ